MKPNVFSRRTQFLGIGVQHKPTEIYFIECVLSENKFKKIVEFGTLAGAISLRLGIHTLQHKGEMITFDIRNEPKHILWKKMKSILPMEFYKMDVFSSEAQCIVRDFVEEGKALIYCDNGKKRDEFNMYAHLLKPGDYIMAHDYGREIRLRDIEETIEMCDLEQLYDEYRKDLKSRQCCFRKRDSNE